MNKRVLIITDAISSLEIEKDTSIFMMETLLEMKYDVFQCETNDIFVKENIVSANATQIKNINKLDLITADNQEIKLNMLSYCIMRKDPPVDENYLNSLHLLSLAESQGAKIYNSPHALKKYNEKIFALHFPEYIPNTLISSNIAKIESFFNKYKSIVIKPFNGMGGNSIYKIDKLDETSLQTLKKLTHDEKRQIIVQNFIKEIYDGDHRIFIFNGVPYEKTLARIPRDGSFKGNLAAGGRGEVRDITNHQKIIGEKIGEFLVQVGVNFAGIDVIGNYLTEINITSPTCVREVYKETNINPLKDFLKKL